MHTHTKVWVYIKLEAERDLFKERKGQRGKGGGVRSLE